MRLLLLLLDHLPPMLIQNSFSCMSLLSDWHHYQRATTNIINTITTTTNIIETTIYDLQQSFLFSFSKSLFVATVSRAFLLRSATRHFWFLPSLRLIRRARSIFFFVLSLSFVFFFTNTHNCVWHVICSAEPIVGPTDSVAIRNIDCRKKEETYTRTHTHTFSLVSRRHLLLNAAPTQANSRAFAVIGNRPQFLASTKKNLYEI